MSQGPEFETIITETPHGFGVIEVDSSDVLVCKFVCLDDEGNPYEEDKVVEKDLVTFGDHPALPGGVVMWYRQELCIGGLDNVAAVTDTFYAKL